MVATIAEKSMRWWRGPSKIILILMGLLALLFFLYKDSLSYLLHLWQQREEYSYGYLVPLIVVYLLWQKKDFFEGKMFNNSWLGFALVVFGLLFFQFGKLATVYIVEHYSLIFVIMGIALALVGMRNFKQILPPLFILFFMIPLPHFLYDQISQALQLISSEMGVSIIKAFGVSVFLEGNVIDLGELKLQVVEACSGLRYLFPLMTFGFLVAYLFRAPWWQRALIFLSTIPITIVMNSLRIGLIGVSVEYWGEEMAKGFLHDFEGWSVFMVCTGLLLLEVWIFTKLFLRGQKFSDVFGIVQAGNQNDSRALHYREIPASFLATGAMIVVTAIGAAFWPARVEAVVSREPLSLFPLRLQEWQGQPNKMEDIYIDALKFDDYLLADYYNINNNKINLYIAYYASQQAGEAAHSPRTCIPGGGWEIVDIQKIELQARNDTKFPANRVMIERNGQNQLVYYWFQQRGRVLTNEYLTKWYLMQDALFRSRTDGALVRLVTHVKPGERLEVADERLRQFSSLLSSELPKFIPN